MNVTCSVCFARYTVPDDKVTGRRVRMKCKRCGESIAVDGTTSSSQAAPLAASPLLWSVTQPSGRRDKLSTQQLLERYAKNEMEPRTLVWRKGMVKWLPPEFVPELAQALAARGLTVPRASKASRTEDDEATRVGAVVVPKTSDKRSESRRAVDALPNLIPSLDQDPGSPDEATQIFDTRAYAEAATSEKVERESLPNLIPSLDQEPGSADEATQIFDTRAYAAAAESKKDEETTARDLVQLGPPADDEATQIFSRAHASAHPAPVARAATATVARPEQPDSREPLPGDAEDTDVVPLAIVAFAIDEGRARAGALRQPDETPAPRAGRRSKKSRRPLWVPAMLVLLAAGVGVCAIKPSWLTLAKDQLMLVLGQAQPRQ